MRNDTGKIYQLPTGIGKKPKEERPARSNSGGGYSGSGGNRGGGYGGGNSGGGGGYKSRY